MKNKGGRPSKFDHIDMEHVRKLAESGWTDKQMSDFFEVSEVTWNAWKKKNGKFLKSLKDWKEYADNKVERSLYERATSYSHPEAKILNNNGEEMIVDTMKHYAPDPTSMIFWLKNRKTKDWRDKAELDLNAKHSFEDVPTEELRAKYKELLKQEDDK